MKMYCEERRKSSYQQAYISLHLISPCEQGELDNCIIHPRSTIPVFQEIGNTGLLHLLTWWLKRNNSLAHEKDS